MRIGSISNIGYYNIYNSGNATSSYRISGNADTLSSANAAVSGDFDSLSEDEKKKPGRISSPEECQTCKNRKYQDGSDEMNVSFKNAAHISPAAASSAVRVHEGQHVKNAYAKAEQKNGKVVSATVSIHTDVCPECGRTYVSGGTTTSSIKYSNESNPYQKNRKSLDAMALRGANINYAV